MSHDLLVQKAYSGQHADKACACSSKREKTEKGQALKIIVECEAVVSKHSSAISRVDG